MSLNTLKKCIVMYGSMLLIGLMATRVVDMALNGYSEEKRLNAIEMAEGFMKDMDKVLGGI